MMTTILGELKVATEFNEITCSTQQLDIYFTWYPFSIFVIIKYWSQSFI